MTDLERLLYDMVRWAQRAELLVETPARLAYMNDEQLREYECWLADGRRLREQADQLVGFPRGVR